MKNYSFVGCARSAVLTLSLSFCGQSVAAPELDLWAAGGTAMSIVSAIVRYMKPPVSPLGMALDGACALVNGYAAIGGKPGAVPAILEMGCVGSLLLQFTRVVPSLTVGINDPLESVRTVFSVLNMGIIGYRLSQYNKRTNQ